MKRVIDYETALDGIEFGFRPDEEDPSEGEVHVVEPTNEVFERAVVDTLEMIRLAARDEIIELAKRVDALEDA